MGLTRTQIKLWTNGHAFIEPLPLPLSPWTTWMRCGTHRTTCCSHYGKGHLALGPRCPLLPVPPSLSLLFPACAMWDSTQPRGPWASLICSTSWLLSSLISSCNSVGLSQLRWTPALHHWQGLLCLPGTVTSELKSADPGHAWNLEANLAQVPFPGQMSPSGRHWAVPCWGADPVGGCVGWPRRVEGLGCCTGCPPASWRPINC